MLRKMSIIGICVSAFAIIMAFVSISYVGGAPPAIPDTAASRAVQDRIQHAYQVSAAVAHSFDLAALETVYVNDPRGGVLWDQWATLVRDVWQANGDPRLNDPNYVIGYLDYEQAYFGWWQQGVEQRERLHAQAAREQRDLTPAESRSLIDEAGRIAPARGDADARPATLIFLSITIDDDVAVAVVNDISRTMEYTLVHRDNTWFIAGARILRLHP
ncbi:MAG: hypothetical protein MI924_38285 [Chloroflexales bacterium]|nr:hypothetical protein [Chloroflexales bacterium]